MKPPKIGEYWEGQGGIYAGIIRNADNQQQWHLVLSKKVCKPKAWGSYDNTVADCDSRTDGLANTAAILKDKAKHPAAKWAASVTMDGHKDFYLPAQRELNLLYVNLPDHCKPMYHWSSTQYSAYRAWNQTFEDGFQGIYTKDGEFAVRAVRRLPI